MTAKIRSASRRNPALKTFQISVTTSDSVVTLAGAVDSRASVARATEFAHNRYSLDHSLIVREDGTAGCLPVNQRCN